MDNNETPSPDTNKTPKGSKWIKTIGFIVVFLAVAGASAAGIDALASKYLDTSKTSPVVCSGQHTGHQVEIKANAMVPDQINGKLCDTLTITNNDISDRLVAFGPHDAHAPYDGVTEMLLKPGQAFTITFIKLGTYHFHDHLDDIAQGDFTVTR